MMSKIRSIQDSWLAKSILILTALSFMSLFGISGYIGSGSGNRPIIKVDDLVIDQEAITNQYNQEINTARNLLGDNLEISDAIRNSVMLEIVQKNLMNAIMKKTAADLGVSVGDELVRKIIYSQPEFMDASGNFSLEKMRRLLSVSGWSEQRYINTLREDVVKQHLVQTPVEKLNIPQFMNPYLSQLENQRKIFNYIEIVPEKLKIDRKMSQEELEQYYQDFAAQFEEPEKRDLSFIELTVDKLAAGAEPAEADIKQYYQDNISQFVIPEQRKVLQMVFESQDQADKAFAALNTGGDFYTVAKEMAGQDRDATELGLVSKDTLIADMAEPVFELKKGQFTMPVKSELGWHIMKVTGITPKKETPLSAAKAQIADELRKQKAYEIAYEKITEIEDQLGSGAGLNDIASEYGVRTHKVKNLGEDGKVLRAPVAAEKLLRSSDFIETAFSYNAGEISQVVESDNGFLILRVDEIHDAHPLALEKVKGRIEKMWAANEKSAIALELVNDISHDLENGDPLAEVAARFGLQAKTTAPLKHNQSFAGLSAGQMKELFQEGIGAVKTFSEEERTLIAQPAKIIKGNRTTGKEEIDTLRSQAVNELSQSAANALIDAYGSDYKIRVKYKHLGLTD